MTVRYWRRLQRGHEGWAPPETFLDYHASGLAPVGMRPVMAVVMRPLSRSLNVAFGSKAPVHQPAGIGQERNIANTPRRQNKNPAEAGSRRFMLKQIRRNLISRYRSACITLAT
jgi:hypothetical protein